MRTFLLTTLLALGCSHSHDNGFATFQACFDDHHDGEGYDATQSITICTLDHPIDGSLLEFSTAAECVVYVQANVAAADATTAEIEAGCNEYIRQKAL